MVPAEASEDILEGPAEAVLRIPTHRLVLVLLPALLVVGGGRVPTTGGWVGEDEALAAGNEMPEGLDHHVHEAVVLPHAESPRQLDALRGSQCMLPPLLRSLGCR